MNFIKIKIAGAFAFLALIAFQNLQAQSVLLWQRTYGDSLFEQPFGSCHSMDNGIICGGHSNSIPTGTGDIPSNNGDYDWWILKLDSNGHKDWTVCYGGTEYDKCRNASENPDGTILAFGSVKSNDVDVSGNHGDNDYWFLKLDAAGQIIWKKCYGGTLEEGGRSAIQCNDGNYIMAGYSRSSDGDVTANNGSYDVWLVKVTPDSGNIIWNKNYGSSAQDRVRSIAQWPDGNFVFTGNADTADFDTQGNTFHGDEDVWTARIDENGVLIWSSLLGAAGRDRAYYVTRDLDGNVLVAGKNAGNGGDVTDNHGLSDAWFIKLDYADGHTIWKKSFGGTNDDEGFRIDPEPDGGYMLGATTESNDGDSPGTHALSDYWLIRVDSNLNIIWTRCDGGASWDHLNDVVKLNDGGYVGIGFSSSKPGPNSEKSLSLGSFDLWVCKIAYCDTQPVISFNGITNLCDNQTSTLTAPPFAQSYLWSNGETTQSITVNTTGSYNVTVTTNALCTVATPVINLTFNPAPTAPTVFVNGNILTSSPAPNYQWYYNGSSIPGAVTSALTATQPGSYYVVVSSVNGCTAASQTVVWPTGIEDHQSNFLFEIFPNPVKNGTVQITSNAMSADDITVKFFDVRGQLDLTKQIKINGGKSKFNLDVSTLSKGIYTLQFSNDNGIILNKKLVIE